MSFNITNLIQELNIEIITIFTILIACCLAMQDIAVDAFVLKVLTPDYYSHGSSIEVIARIVGIGIACPLFIALNSNKFPNKYLRSQSSYDGMVTSS